MYIVPLIHAIGSACADLAFFKFVKRFYGSDIANKASFCRTISWFTMYMSTRSLTNNLEEIFTIFCLASLHKPSTDEKITNQNNYWILHLFGFVSFATRATSAINLIPIYVYQFFGLCSTNYSKFKLFYQFTLIGFVCLFFLSINDSMYYIF